MNAAVPNRFSSDAVERLVHTATFPNQVVFEASATNQQTFLLSGRDQYGAIDDIEDHIGSKSFVLKGVLEGGTSPLALKLCSEPVDPNALTNKTELAGKLHDANGLFVQSLQVGKVHLDLNIPGLPTVWCAYLMPWIEGQTLYRWLEQEKSRLHPLAVVAIAQQLLAAVYYLKEKGLRHDDLHSKNIIVRRQSIDFFRSEGPDALTLTIIDSGSFKLLGDANLKVHDDYSMVVRILVDIFNTFYSQRRTVGAYPQFTIKFKQLIEALADADHERAFPRGSDDLRDMFDALRTATSGHFVSDARTFSPFDAISAEHLANDVILLELFEESLPWFIPLKADSPCVLTGPRGCGKSMAFRFLSAKTHLHGNSLKKLEELPFLGIYISCATEMQNNLLWVARQPELVANLSPWITTYFQCVLLKELFRTLALISAKPDAMSLYGLRGASFSDAIGLVDQKLKVRPAFRDSGLVGRLQAVATEFEHARHFLANQLQTRAMPADDVLVLAPSFAADVVSALSARSDMFNGRKICFLLDDYTDYRIKPPIQSVLNKVIFERRNSQIFKVSAERYGFDPRDIDNIGHEDTREFSPLDAGDHFLGQAGRNTAKSFTQQLLNRRLQAAGWDSKIENILGTSKYESDKALADALRVGTKHCFHGLETLSRLLSGDIATMIHVVREIFRLGRVDKKNPNLVSHKDQDDAICAVSRSLVERIQSYNPHGPELHSITTEFGGVLRRIMAEAPLVSVSGGGTDKQPARKLQIELAVENPNAIFESMRDVGGTKAEELLRHLIRRGIFIHRDDSGSKRGEGKRTARLHIRRALLPAFKVSLVRHGYVDLNAIEDLHSLLIEPRVFCEREWEKSNASARKAKKPGPGQPTEQTSIFDKL